jgi:hypothetical protein
LPGIEITDHRDLRGIGRPNAKGGARLIRMRAEQPVGLKIPAFVEQVKLV